MHRFIFGTTCRVLVLLSAASLAWGQSTPPPAVADAPRLPLAFEPNRGQTDATVDFFARGGGVGVWLTASGPVLALDEPQAKRGHVLRLELLGADPAARAAGEVPLPGMVHRYALDGRQAPFEAIPRYARVRYREVLPGVDLVYRADAEQRLEYDFELGAGVDPSGLSWRLHGAERARLEQDGALALTLGARTLTLRPPFAFQVVDGRRRPVQARYRLQRDRLGFELGHYDPELPLVIDPVVAYGSYLGGSDYDGVEDIARGSDGSLYLTGYTWSSNFPTLNPIHGHLGAKDAFVTKLTPDGSSLVFSTYVGGAGMQQGNAIEVDGQSRPVICGFSEPEGQSSNPFVLRLNATGTLSYSRVTTTAQGDECLDLALDGEQAIAVGYTFSDADFPRVAHLTNWNVANGDAPFLLRYDAGGTLVQATLLPNHANSNDAAHGVAVHAGHAYVTGTWGGTAGDQSNRQAFVIKLDADNVFEPATEYLRSFGGTTPATGETSYGAYEAGHGIAVDSIGRAFVAGVTHSTDFPLVGGPFQSSYNGGGDAFIVRLSDIGNVTFASYLHAGLGNGFYEQPRRIAFDPVNTLYVVGDFNGYALFGRLPNFATQLDYLQTLGSFYFEAGPANGIVLAGNAAPIVAGESAGSRFPITPGAVQPTLGGNQDGYVLRFEERLPVISIQHATVSEGAGCVDLVVRTDAASIRDVRFDWSASPGTALAGSDYNAGSGNDIGISSGATWPNVNVSVCPVDDALDEDNETLTVSLSGVTGATLGQVSATITIVDNDAAPTLSIDNGGCSVSEGDGGGSTCNFVLRLSAATSRSVSFTTATGAGTAGAGDFSGHGATARSIAAGQTTLNLAVPVTGDVLDEADETFSLGVSGISNASPGSLAATGTILDDDAAPTLSVDAGGCAVNEGHSGSTLCNFVLRLSAVSGRTVTFNTATTAGSASAADFSGHASTARSIAAGQTTLTVAVPVTGDTLDEADESFTLGVSGVGNATPASLAATGTISDDDAAPTLSVDNGGCSVTEGHSGSSACNFVLRLSAASGKTVSFSTGTTAGSAGGADYTGHATTARSIAAGQTTLTVAVPVTGDVLDENTETFTLDVTAVSNASPATLVATGTINDDDAAPTLSVDAGGCSVTEGHSGSSNCNFVLRLSATSGKTVSFSTGTTAGSAGGADYTGHATTARSIAAGQTTLTVAVPVTGDVLDEDSETFTLEVTAVSNASPAALVATGTINDDDAAPTLSVDAGGCSVSEGHSGSSNCNFVLRLSATSGKTVSFSTGTTAGTAGGADYTGHATTARSITAGQTTLTVAVPVTGDVLDENTETFTLDVTAVSNASPATLVATGTINDDDAAPTLSVDAGGCSVSEGHSGSVNCTFVVRLSAVSAKTVSFSSATANGSALAGSDYSGHAATARSIAAGQTTLGIAVPVTGDTRDEVDETFTLALSSIGNATPASLTATGSIVDDDAAPTLTVDDGGCSVSEGNSGSTNCSFVLRLSAASGKTVSFTTATANGSALAGSDYTGHATAARSIAAGETQLTLAVPVLGDGLAEGNETFTLALRSIANAGPASLDATGTIVDDEGAPTLSIDDASRSEGDAGSAPAVFAVTLAPPSATPVTVSWSTSDLTALAASDYDAAAGQLAFAAGETAKTVSVGVRGDTSDEADETFRVALTLASGAALGDAQATGTIVDDDGTPQPGSLRFELAAYGASENAGLQRIRVLRTGGSDGVASVRLRTVAGTATAPADYVALDQLLSWPAGDVGAREVDLLLVAGDGPEPDESLTLVLEQATGATLGAPASATMQILDGERVVYRNGFESPHTRFDR